MMNRLSLFLLLTLSPFLVHSTAYGQSNDPDGFFKGGYVKGGQKRGDTNPAISNNTKAPLFSEETVSKQLPSGSTKSQDTDSGFVTAPLSPIEKIEQSRLEKIQEEMKKEENIPILALAIVLNGTTAEQTFPRIKRYADLLVKHELEPEAIYTMQIPQFFSEESPSDWLKVVVRGATLEMNRDLIEKYKIEKVPTWIARTAKGDVVLEGYEDISQFISINGELISSALKDKNEAQSPILEQNSEPIVPDNIEQAFPEEIRALLKKRKEKLAADSANP